MGIQTKNIINNIHEIDWNEVIKNIKKSDPKKKRNPDFWDKRAPSFADHVSKSIYSDLFLKILDPDPDWTVLDMGCGGGTIALPLASRVKHITAVDFSPKMIEILNKETSRQEIKNIKTIEADWTDNWVEKGIGTYDVAIASRSLAVDDILRAIIKLNNAARKKVIITTIVGDGPHDRKIFQAAGRQYTPGIDYIYYYNLLYQAGIFANISFITTENPKTFSNVKEACESVKWMLQDITDHENALLEKFITDHLVETKEGLTMNYRKESTWAVMWWDK